MPEFPGPRSKEWLGRREKAVPRDVFTTLPMFLESLEPAAITDVDGNRYIDFAGGLDVLNVGRGNARVTEAVRAQVEAYLHECFHVTMYPGDIELAEALNRV